MAIDLHPRDPFALKRRLVAPRGVSAALVLAEVERMLARRGYAAAQTGAGVLTFTGRERPHLRQDRPGFDVLFVRGTARFTHHPAVGVSVEVELRIDTPFSIGLLLLSLVIAVVFPMEWYLRLGVILLFLALFARIRQNTAGEVANWICLAAEAYTLPPPAPSRATLPPLRPNP